MANMRMTRQHRGLRSYIWTRQQALQLVVVLALWWAVLWGLHQHIVQGWAHVLAWAWPQLGLGPSTAVKLSAAGPFGFPVTVIRTEFFVPAPSLWQWWLGFVASVSLLVSSGVLSRERLPLIYALRIIGFLGLVSLLAYEYLPALLVSDVNRLLTDNMLDIGLAMLWVLPLVHALVLYIFPLPVLLKVLATFCGLLFIGVSIPLQAASLAWVASQGSLVVAVPLYMLCTFLPQIVGQLGIYGLFMSLAPAPQF